MNKLSRKQWVAFKKFVAHMSLLLQETTIPTIPATARLKLRIYWKVGGHQQWLVPKLCDLIWMEHDGTISTWYGYLVGQVSEKTCSLSFFLVEGKLDAGPIWVSGWKTSCDWHWWFLWRVECLRHFQGTSQNRRNFLWNWAWTGDYFLNAIWADRKRKSEKIVVGSWLP